MSPFELATGQQPLTPHEVPRQRTGRKCPSAYRLARSRQEMLDWKRGKTACLDKAIRRMKKYADKGPKEMEFKVGEKVMLKLTPQIGKKISSKTVHRGLIPKPLERRG
jgi:hypothetical protein